MVQRHDTEHGTVTYLEKIELLQNNLLAAHTVWVNDAEVDAASDINLMLSLFYYRCLAFDHGLHL